MNSDLQQRMEAVLADALDQQEMSGASVLVMKDGNIIEQGNHETLLAQGGFYANLYNSQFEQVS